MGNLVISENVSLDGVMQSPGPTDVAFRYRGWAVDFQSAPGSEGFDFAAEVGLPQARSTDALLLGRITYEAMRAAWPNLEGDLADRLNELPKYVVSSTLSDPSWKATRLDEDWKRQVAALKDELEGDLVVYGSRRLARALLELGMVDRIALTVYPLVLGTGERLFEGAPENLRLELIESRPVGAGVLSTVYAPAG